MLTGRETELARMVELVEDVARGRGQALVVHGAAGIGKSALLEAAGLVARQRGVQVLSVAGVESEAELAFSGLHDLLSPVISERRVLPAPQSAALASALALEEVVPGDRFGVCVATLRLLEHTAAATPLLVIVDDLPWLDSASRECIMFAARRVSGPFAMVLAERDEDHPSLCTHVPELVVPRLRHAAAVQLLTHAAPDMVTSVAAVVAEAADGNPLALQGLAAALDPAQRSGLAELPVPLAPGLQLNTLYQKRLAGLPREHPAGAPDRRGLPGRRPEGDRLRLLRAERRRQPASRRPRRSSSSGSGRVELSFAHPLVRGAIYHQSPTAERRSVHAALAGVLQGESRAWHLGIATLTPDEAVACELEAPGRPHWPAGVPVRPSSALERAARLSPDAERCARRLLAAGEAAFAAGLPDRAMRLLGEAATTTADSAVRAAANHRHGQTLVVSAQLPRAIDLLTREAERTKADHPSVAAAMMSEAALACLVTADCRRALQLARAAADLIEPGAPQEVRAHVAAMLRTALVFRGVRDRTHPLLSEADSLIQSVDPLSPAGQSLTVVLNLRPWTGDLERVRDDALTACARARDLGALSAVPMLLVVLADCQYRLGDWVASETAATEASLTGQELNQPNAAGHASLIMARLAAARGTDEQGCRATIAATMAADEAAGARSAVPYAFAALGFLDLGRGRIQPAIEHLERVARFYDESGMEEPTLIPWEADLVEAYLRAGRVDAATAAIAVMGRRAAASGVPIAIAPYRRCRGMLAKDFDSHFQAALDAHQQRPMPFERARTLLAYGRRLHRVRRRAEARAVLHDAVSGFTALGAAPWLDQAEAELRAAGGRRSSVLGKTESTSGTLTPHERYVAQTVARGLSNRQAAAELFLSPKTVEFHLVHIYRKLGISSRSQLIEALRRTGDHT